MTRDEALRRYQAAIQKAEDVYQKRLSAIEAEETAPPKEARIDPDIRKRAMRRMRKRGAKLRDVAAQFGVSSSRAAQIIADFERKILSKWNRRRTRHKHEHECLLGWSFDRQDTAPEEPKPVIFAPAPTKAAKQVLNGSAARYLF